MITANLTVVQPGSVSWRKFVGLLLWLLLGLFVLPEGRNLLAQDSARGIKFERIPLEQGRTIYCILQDHQGFMWFGTADGLIKYDGYSFTAYRHDAFDSLSLSSNLVYALREDHTHTLWVGTVGGGLNRFERERERFTRFVNNPDDPHSLSFNSIGTIYADRSGTLWIGTADLLSEAGGGLNKFDREKQQFIRFVHNPNDAHSLSHNTVWAINEDHNGTLWIGTQNGLNRFNRDLDSPSKEINGQSGLFTRFAHDPNIPSSLSHNDVRIIYEDRSHILWLGTRGGGLNRFDRTQQVFTRFEHDRNNPYSLSQDSVLAICEDNAGMLWIGTFGGLNRFDRVQEQFSRFVHEPQNPQSIDHNIIWSLYQDRADALWIGPFIGGINKFDRKKERFTQFIPAPDMQYRPSKKASGPVYQDQNGTHWVGTPAGLSRFDSAAKNFSYLFNKSLNSQANWAYGDFSSRGTFWVGTNGNGLYRIDHNTGQSTQFLNDPNDTHSISDSQITSLYEDRFGTLWIATWGGLNCFDRAQEKFIRYVHNPNDSHSISNDAINSICEDPVSQDILWIATSNGLNRFDRQTERFTRFLTDSNNPTSLSDNFIWTLLVDHTGRVWIGTMSGGLNCFDPGTEQFTHFTIKDGLPNNSIVGILEDAHGRLWLSTSKGLSCFDLKTKTFRNYELVTG